jgi:asparagine synthase (glutamine-hydrolysing)
MTALAGIWRMDGQPEAAEGCARMLAAQELYGRDDSAQWSRANVALGRRLMRVLPEDIFDRQPLVGGGGRYVLVADIRLDNRDDITRALDISAARAATLCDAALLLAAVERWNDSVVERIVGDYAFVLWDDERRRFMLARDPMGRRPLHYHRSDNLFAFASMPKGLHALPEIPYRPDEERVAEFLALIPETGTKSYFQGIERVQPGYVVLATKDGLTTTRYWKPSGKKVVFKQPEDYSDAIRALLDQAVQCRLRGPKEIGVFLSGGLDSGAVATTAARLLGAVGGRVIAFTGMPREAYSGVAPRNRIIDESPYAAATASLYPNIEHVLVPNEGRSPLADLDRDFYLFDRPMLTLCGRGWSESFNKAVKKRNVKVTLGGNAGNIGLSYDGKELLPELFRSGRWLRLWREARALVAPGNMRWRGVLATMLGPWCPQSLWVVINRIANGYALEIDGYTAINPRLVASMDMPGRAKASGFDLSYRPPKDGTAARISALHRIDPGNFLKGTLGGWQIDHRDPTADIRLLDFCLSIPTEQFLSGGTQRALARRALADRLPEVVLHERLRGLQVADWHVDLSAAREQIADELQRLEACQAATTALDLPRMRKLTENWPSEGWESQETTMSYRYALLRGIAVGHFLRRTTGGNR